MDRFERTQVVRDRFDRVQAVQHVRIQVAHIHTIVVDFVHLLAKNKFLHHQLSIIDYK